MANPKRVMVGGGLVRGHTLVVASTPGSYVMTVINPVGAALNVFTIIPDGYGVGDTFRLDHYDDIAGTGNIKAVLAEDIPNMGANAAICLDLHAIQRIDRTESLKLTYTNVASQAINVYALSDWVGISKTA